MNEFDDPPMPGAKVKPVIPRFHTVSVKLEFASGQAGRPIFEDREFVDIIVPGSRNQIAHEPVNDEHKARWPREYQAFKEGIEAPLEGTPLAQWPGMTRSRVEELAHFHIRTVEELSTVNDGQLQHLGMGARAEREKAKLFLEAARVGSAPLERMIARNEELVRENERLSRELTAANSQILNLKAQLEEPRHGSAAA